jgi:hypothetical protein
VRVFIGSSYEQRRLVEWLTNFMRTEYGGRIDPVPWTAYWPGGKYTYEHLENLVSSTDAAILFWTADDRTWYRETERHEPRDNLVFEAGLFFAAHGRRRTQLLLPTYASSDKRKVAIPSDLYGLTVTYYQWADEEVAATGLPYSARNVCDALSQLGPRPRLPVELQFLQSHREIEEVSTLVGDFRTMLNDGIGRLAGGDHVQQIDILVAYRVGDIRRVLDGFRKRAGGRLRVCFADMWDDELLKVYQRKYADRNAEQIRNALRESIQGLLGQCDLDIKEERLVGVSNLRADPHAQYEVRLTSQRLTYSFYRVDRVLFVIPLDMKTEQNPPPVAWAIAQDTAPRTYQHYFEEFTRMFEEARCVYPA